MPRKSSFQVSKIFKIPIKLILSVKRVEISLHIINITKTKKRTIKECTINFDALRKEFHCPIYTSALFPFQLRYLLMPQRNSSTQVKILWIFQDKQFGKVPLFYPHSNPEAKVASAIKCYKQYSLERAYLGETFFWGLLPQPGDQLLFKFETPLIIKRQVQVYLQLLKGRCRCS